MAPGLLLLRFYTFLYFLSQKKENKIFYVFLIHTEQLLAKIKNQYLRKIDETQSFRAIGGISCSGFFLWRGSYGAPFNFLFLFALKGARFAVGSHYAGAESFRFDGGWPPLLVFRTFGRSVVLSWVPSRFRLFGA